MKMKLTTRTSKGGKLSIKEMDTNLTYLESIGGNSSDPVYYAINKLCTSYPYPRIGFNLISKDKFLKPDNGLYLLSSVETYLKFAEAFGSNGQDSNYFTRGEYNGIPQNAIPRRETSVNVFASVETYLKFAEAIGLTNNNNNNWPEIISALGTTDNGFNTQLRSLLENPLINYEGETLPSRIKNITDILNRGIVEVNSIKNESTLDRILDNLDMYSINSFDNFPDYTLGIYDGPYWRLASNENYSIAPKRFMLFLDNGLVVWENPKYLSISNTEETLKYLEYYHTTIGGVS